MENKDLVKMDGNFRKLLSLNLNSKTDTKGTGRNALIKAVCESKLDAKVDFTQKWISLWVFGEDSVKFSLDIFVEGYTRKENHAKFKEMIKYLKGE